MNIKGAKKKEYKDSLERNIHKTQTLRHPNSHTPHTTHMNGSNFHLPRSAAIPTSFHGPPATEANNFAGKKRAYQASNHTNPSTAQHRPPPTKSPRTSSSTLSMDYHLRIPVVTDNPKKLAKFDFIRVIPKGKEYAVYLQHHTLTFFPKDSAIPSATIALGKEDRTTKNVAPQMLFFCTQVKATFFVVTDISVYHHTELLTNEERIRTLVSVFKQGILSQIHQRHSSTDNGNRRTNLVDPNFENISFHSTYFFSQWTDFAKGSLHIPYEIKHLEYCFYNENVNKQTQRFIYILNKKMLKKFTHDTDLVYTTSREFRVVNVQRTGSSHQLLDLSTQQLSSQPLLLDFKTSVLTNHPYVNVLGYSHLDKQEESEGEEEEEKQ
jgi:hypothetical protein